MRNVSVLTVFTLVMLSVVGCGGMSSEQHELSRARDVASVEALASGDTRTFSSDGQSTQVQGQVSAQVVQQDQAVDSCSGSCNATTCSCYGTYECCRAGCSACWAVLDQAP